MSSGLGGRRGLGALFLVVVVTLAGSAVVTGAFGPMQQPSGDEVLDRVEHRYESAETLTAVATVTVENDTASTTATVQLAAASDNRSRAILTRDGSTYRMGSDGTVVWTVGPNKSAVWPVEAVTEGDTAVQTAVSEDTVPSEQFATEGVPTVNASNVSATLVGTPSVDGVSTYKVELTRPDVNATTSLWVSQDDYRLVRAVTTDGTNRTVVSVESTEFNVSIHESTFEPPSDRIAASSVEQYDEFDAAQSATELSLPYLDDTFASATVTVRQGETVVGQRYARDAGNVTVISTTATDRFDRLSENASTTTVADRTVTVTTTDDRAVAAWTADGVTTVVAVDGSTERAVEIVDELIG